MSHSKNHRVSLGTVAILALSFVVLSVSSLAQQKPQNARQEKQKAAEEAVDRILRRFYQTLDVGVIYREMYVSDPELRRVEVEIITDNMMGGWDAHRKIDFATRERAYTALLNFWWLVSAMNATRPNESDPKDLEKIGETYASLFSKRRKILTAETLDKEFVVVLNQINDELRKRVVPQNFNTATYKANVGKIHEDQPDEKAELKKLFLGVGILGPDTEIFLVRRERYYYYLIEENGSFKLLTDSSRIRF